MRPSASIYRRMGKGLCVQPCTALRISDLHTFSGERTARIGDFVYTFFFDNSRWLQGNFWVKLDRTQFSAFELKYLRPITLNCAHLVSFGRYSCCRRQRCQIVDSSQTCPLCSPETLAQLPFLIPKPEPVVVVLASPLWDMVILGGAWAVIKISLAITSVASRHE